MTKLTACLIVKNEELFIERCIESLLKVSDEVIITDTGSTDKTKDICANYPQVKVFDYEWDDNYSNPRNDGLKYATGDWILFVGADEVLSDDLVKNLPILISKDYEPNTVFCFNVLNPSPSGITTSYFRQALFKNNQGIKFFRPIHEQLIKENEELININCPEMNIIHYNKMKLNQDLEAKYSKYIGILNKAIESNNDKNDNYYYYHHLGNAYAQKNEHKKAYEAFLESYKLYNEGEYNKNTLAYGTILIKLISQLVIYSDIKNQAQIYLDELFDISPDFTDGLFYQTIVFQENKEYEKALDNARKLYFYLVEGKYNNPLGIVSQGISILPDILIDLASLSYLNGFKEDAGRIADRASKLFPENVIVQKYLAQYHLLNNDYYKSIYYFNKAFEHNINSIKNIEILINEPKKFIKEKEIELQIEILKNISNSDLWNIAEKNIIANKIYELENQLNPKISVCLITKNEEDCLERCLESVKDIAYEILITDTGSTDNTKDIAKKYGQVFDYTWENDFSKARNKSIENASGDWVLWIDADEVISKETKENIVKLLKNTPHKNKAVIFCIKNLNFSTQGSVDTSYFKQNLFRNKKGMKFTSPIHEFLICENEKIISEDCENLEITHFETLKSDERLKEKHLSYIKILKDILSSQEKENDDYYYHLHLANSLVYVDDIEQAIKEYKESYKLSQNNINVLKVIIKELLFIHNKPNESLIFIDIEENKDNELWYLKAFALQNLEKIKESIEIYESILVKENGGLRKIVLLELSKCYSFINQIDKEYLFLKEIFDLDKLFYPCIFRLIKYYLFTDNLSEAINILSLTKMLSNDQLKRLNIKSRHNKYSIEFLIVKVMLSKILYDVNLDYFEIKQLDKITSETNNELYNLLDDLMYEEKYDKAISYCDELLLIDNTSIVGLFTLATCNLKQNEIENARLLFEYILKLIDNPKNNLEKDIRSMIEKTLITDLI